MYLLGKNLYPKLNLLDAGGSAGGSGGGAGDGGGGAASGTNDGGGNTAGASANGGNANGASGSGVNWDSIKASLPEDLRNDSSMSTIKDLTGLVKGYVHSQRLIGKNNVPIPDPKHATTEDWLHVFRKLGAPEKVEDFKIKLPDGVKEEAMDQTFLKEVKEAAVSVGVLPWQFEKIFGAYHKSVDSKLKESDAEMKRQMTEDQNSLKVEWGQAFDAQVKRANVALKELVPNEADRVRLVQDGLGSHPVVLKMLANASKLFKEDTFLGHGEGTLAGMTPADALKRAREIQGDANHAYRNKNHPNHKNAQEEVRNLYKIAFPN